MPLTEKITHRDNLDATEVQQLFDDLADAANGIAEEQIERGAIQTRHMNTPTKEVQVENDAGPYVGAAYAKICPTGVVNWNATIGEAVWIQWECIIQATGAAHNTELELRIDGNPVQHRQWNMGNGMWRTVHGGFVFEASAVNHLIEIFSRGNNHSVTVSQITVVAVVR